MKKKRKTLGGRKGGGGAAPRYQGKRQLVGKCEEQITEEEETYEALVGKEEETLHEGTENRARPPSRRR